MTKSEFLFQLKQSLSELPESEIERSCVFYAEMIDDRIECGMTEEEAVEQLGRPEEIAKDILLDMPLSKIIKNKCKKKKEWQAWEIVLLILGAPLWVPLLISTAAVVLSIYIVIWSMMISLWAIVVSLGAVFVGSIIIFCSTVAAAPMTATVNLGVGLICAGISALGILGCSKLTSLLVKFSGYIMRKIKSLFIGRKEREE